MNARINAYLAKCPPAVSGQGGHNQTLKVASALVRGFDLTVEEGLPYLEQYNYGCRPPWKRKELLHKLEDAKKNNQGKPRGYLLENNPTLPARPKYAYPSVGEPIMGVKPFKTHLDDGYDTSFQLGDIKTTNIYTTISQQTIKHPSYPSYIAGQARQADRRDGSQSRRRSNKESTSMDFQAASRRQMAEVPAGYDPVMWARHCRAIPLRRINPDDDHFSADEHPHN